MERLVGQKERKAKIKIKGISIIAVICLLLYSIDVHPKTSNI